MLERLEAFMKLVTSFENPPIPWRKFDWVALDEDQMSGVCGDPDCHCRQNLVRGWGETEEQAVVAFVRCLLAGLGIELLEETAEYELLDYDVLESSDDQEVREYFESRSPELRAYMEKRLPREYERFQERLREGIKCAAAENQQSTVK
jgi:hypothetical protein